MSLKSKLGKVGRVLSNPAFYRYFFQNLIRTRNLNKPPVIICGCPRSGTTLLMSILDSHPELHVIPFETAVLQYRPKEDRLFKRDALHYAFCKVQLLLYLFSGPIKNRANRWCEKTPLNILNVDEIRKMYGAVLFINMVRDGRDVVSSYHKRMGYMVSPDLWLRCVEASNSQRSQQDFISVQYEQLVTQPASVLSRIQLFLNLNEPFNTDNWIENTRVNENKSLVNGKEMIFHLSEVNRNSIGKFKSSASPFLTKFMHSKACLAQNKELGYE